MQAYDIIMLAVVGVAALLGYRKGLAWQAASLGSIVVSYLVAFRFHRQLAPHIGLADPWNNFAAMLVLYLATSLAIWFLFRLVRSFLERARLREFDQQLGALFGALKGGLLCVVITLVVVNTVGGGWRASVADSRSGYFVARLVTRCRRLIPPDVLASVAPLLDRLDEGLAGESGQSGKGTLPVERQANRWDEDRGWEVR
jgi:membrane protein required for colicin V production